MVFSKKKKKNAQRTIPRESQNLVPIQNCLLRHVPKSEDACIILNRKCGISLIIISLPLSLKDTPSLNSNIYKRNHTNRAQTLFHVRTSPFLRKETCDFGPAIPGQVNQCDQ
ncbi:hypothetical protein, unlikely [Trypanosoma brucei gambiense DAL972]|uniref:Uncharacterized protein n=1 Tax=Trypanosoma brucei gambiense (strain MHOM/CI/86/DAL972) TaxID=679716 RepID=C9ZJR7_TRYB9|nr:hypothetical protein, unlikely [Trypanosoma brucei gambiense DAL972]CBH09627.1 hypothetical protein, unlikely [Trypanosoma brucei gambiense DAL972]|eukprot:XP_011771931.1 hypothetical protein, unlikely [Trypanosoma brucei gambiense DAL972]